MAENLLSVAEYVLTRLSQLGIDRIFGVPGDYAFPIDNAAEKVPGLTWVGCGNELNAAYAADGYARVRGAAILTTTYGVGELSAINGVMGSKAHRLPIFHLVGMPSERIQGLGLVTHHNLGDTIYDRFWSISAAACCVSAVLTPGNCVDELERVIREALGQSMPAYIVISHVQGGLPVLGTSVSGRPLADVKRQQSVRSELEAAVATLITRIAAAQRPVAIVTSLVTRYGMRDRALEFIRKANLPVAVMPNDKGTVDESLPSFVGLYAGVMSSSPAVCDLVRNADLVVDVGGFLLTELNTGFWTDVPALDRVISIHDSWVRAADKVFVNTAIDDVLAALIENVPTCRTTSLIRVEPLPLTGRSDDRLGSPVFYARLQRRLRKGDTIVAETGTCMMHLNRMLLPEGVTLEGQGLWGSIGWATPACMGVAMAKTTGRTWLITGDGAHQCTLNELAVMGRYGVSPIIFVLNNGLFGVEEVISERGHAYDDLAPVRYHLLPEAFGCEGWLAARVATVGELDQILNRIACHDGAAYVEVLIPNEESQPLPAAMIDNGYKVSTPPAG